MTCDGCAKDITGALHKLPGITKVEANVADQLVSVEGTGSSDGAAIFRVHRTVYANPETLTAAPSAIVEAIQATGRDAILRGSGTSNSKCSDTPACLNPFSMFLLGVPCLPLDSNAKADPQIFPRSKLIRFVSFFFLLLQVLL